MAKCLTILTAAFAAVFLTGVWWFSRDVQEGLSGGDSPYSLGNDGMPLCFEGFVDRWNREVAYWLTAESARLERETDGSEEEKKALASIRERGQNRDFLKILPAEALPAGLLWKDGMEQPDIGDPRALKGGEIRIWGGVMFPSTFRRFGPDSVSFFGYSMYEQVDMKLVGIHPQTEEIIPGLADRWAVSSNGKTVFFHLDPVATYSDGTPVRIMDYILNICLRTSPFAKDPFYAETLRKQVAGIRIYGEEVLAMELTAPVPWAPFRAASMMAPANPGFYAGFNAGFVHQYQWRVPPGTGGYILDESRIIRGRELTLKRVKNWWAAGKKFYRYSCNVDAVTHSFFREEKKATELFCLGRLDVLMMYKPELWENSSGFSSVLDGYVERVSFARRFPEPPYGIYLNTAVQPLDNPDVREGVVRAMPMKEAIVQQFRGYYSQLNSFADGYGPMTADLDWSEYSPSLARSYFAKAGYRKTGPDGILINESGDRLCIELSYAELSPLMGNVCRKLKEGARDCGLDLRLDPLDGDVCARKVNDKRHMAAMWATMLDYPVPNLFPLFHSSRARDGKGRLVPNTENVFSIADKELDQGLEDVRKAVDREQLREALVRVQERIRNLNIWIPGWKDDMARMSFWRWVRWPESETTRFCVPIIFNPLESHLYWIDPEIKKEVEEARRERRKLPESERMISPIEGNEEKRGPIGSGI